MNTTSLTQDQVSQYQKDGFIVIKGFFNRQEASRLYEIASSDDVLNNNAFDFGDTQGKRTKLTLWYTPGNDPYGMMVKSERMLNAVAGLLGRQSPICHFHSKLMQKEPRVGGAWEWHQDYGYWYKNGFIFPEQMMSVMVALTEANIENGCLQVIRGSHVMGRIEHTFAGEQQGADMAFVNEALKHMPLEYVELQPGDALFFHSNILHRSEANNSDRPRWSFISCYNLETNKPYMKETPSSSYTPLQMVTDQEMTAALESGSTLSVSEAEFWSKEKDLAHRK
ncbi:MAG: phytanoyl-CoA dioxygenase family protein [Chitinophagaceae bacterium]|nr:phytanoyl-CoA dioxygenase family protein [Chitinophagaceae bacterium]